MRLKSKHKSCLSLYMRISTNEDTEIMHNGPPGKYPYQVIHENRKENNHRTKNHSWNNQIRKRMKSLKLTVHLNDGVGDLDFLESHVSGNDDDLCSQIGGFTKRRRYEGYLRRQWKVWSVVGGTIDGKWRR